MQLQPVLAQQTPESASSGLRPDTTLKPLRHERAGFASFKAQALFCDLWRQLLLLFPCASSAGLSTFVMPSRGGN